jgi:hypothetical protein
MPHPVLAIALADDVFGPALLLALIAGFVALLWGRRWLQQRRFLDARLTRRCPNAARWPVHTKTFPHYRLVDLVQAAERLASENPRSELLSAISHFDLGVLLSRRVLAPTQRLVQAAPLVPLKTGPHDERFVPTQLFLVLCDAPASARGTAIVRVRSIGGAQVLLEVAAPMQDAAEATIERVTALASTHSIYRNRTVRVVPGANARAAYEEDGGQAPLDLSFVPEGAVTDATIVLDDTLRALLERTLVDFHQRRATLMTLGLPGRRGVLFYGPPGTGKTYTAKYLAHRLQPVTTLIAAGNALYQLAAICAIARALQPALVVLEDVDLVFTERAQNATPTLLGEFMDQLDGFGSDDHIIFVLTTNVLERVESAIKDRPGRISQCVYFGPPSAPLRLRYLETLLAHYDCTSVDLHRLVGRTEGVSQAFLKELAVRAVQLASRRRPAQTVALALTNEDFGAALTDMTTGAGPAAKRIIGFRIEA